MKTAISLPNELFTRAEETAQRLGIARSQLLARALEEFLTRYEEQTVTERIDAILATADSNLAADLVQLQAASLHYADEAW